MKIFSRPESVVAGSGNYTIKMDFEELQLIAAVLFITRLGSGSPYRDAALKLLTTLEQGLFDSDFTAEAGDDVDLSISVLSDDGDTILKQYHHSTICIEV